MAKKYKVKHGENLGSIADKFGLVSWKYLYEINQDVIGENPDDLPEGTVIEIPMWDHTSGDEKIAEKGASVFKYTGGLRYRYPWVPFSATLTDEKGENYQEEREDGSKSEEFEKEWPVVFKNSKTGKEIGRLNIKGNKETGLLLPDTDDIKMESDGKKFIS